MLRALRRFLASHDGVFPLPLTGEGGQGVRVDGRARRPGLRDRGLGLLARQGRPAYKGRGLGLAGHGGPAYGTGG